MKVAILTLFITFVATTYAAPIEEPIPIISQDAEVGFDGAYHFAYETGNGIVSQEHGVLKNPGVENVEAEEVSGSFSYPSPDGTLIKLSYVANENGFQPTGDHLPTAPK